MNRAHSALLGRRILIVEDETIIAMLLEDMLEDLGCEVAAVAARTAAALAAIEAHPPDAAILDLNLDGVKSDEVADALSARGVPFLFATGYGDAGLSERYRDRPVLSKPFRRNDLERALERLLPPPYRPPL